MPPGRPAGWRRTSRFAMGSRAFNFVPRFSSRPQSQPRTRKRKCRTVRIHKERIPNRIAGGGASSRRRFSGLCSRFRGWGREPESMRKLGNRNPGQRRRQSLDDGRHRNVRRQRGNPCGPAAERGLQRQHLSGGTITGGSMFGSSLTVQTFPNVTAVQRLRRSIHRIVASRVRHRVRPGNATGVRERDADRHAREWAADQRSDLGAVGRTSGGAERLECLFKPCLKWHSFQEVSARDAPISTAPRRARTSGRRPRYWANAWLTRPWSRTCPRCACGRSSSA
jgi:hypothetical protein